MTLTYARRQEIDNEMADINNAIDSARAILLRTNQRSEHDRQIAAEAERTIKSLEAVKAKLMKERTKGR